MSLEDIEADLPAALSDLQRRAQAGYSRYRADVTDNPAHGSGVTLPRTPSYAVAAAEMIALTAKKDARVGRSTDLSQDERLLSKSISAWTRGTKRPQNLEQLLLLVRVWGRWAGRREDLERWEGLFYRSAPPDAHGGLEVVNYAIDFVQVLGPGLATNAVYSAMTAWVHQWQERRIRGERPTSLQTAAMARALVRATWNDDLPGDADPFSESYGVDGYQVVFRHLNEEYTVRGKWAKDERPEVSRKRLA